MSTFSGADAEDPHRECHLRTLQALLELAEAEEGPRSLTDVTELQGAGHSQKLWCSLFFSVFAGGK